MRSYVSLFLGLLAVQQAAAVSCLNNADPVHWGLTESIDFMGRLSEAANLLGCLQPVYRSTKVWLGL